jgi:cell division protein FtsB
MQRRLTYYLQRFFLNKYFVVLLLFFVYLIFFDDHNLIKRFQTRHEIKQLEQEYQFYNNEIETNKTKIHQLKNDSVFLEKFAREKYYMKRNNEDVFIMK